MMNYVTLKNCIEVIDCYENYQQNFTYNKNIFRILPDKPATAKFTGLPDVARITLYHAASVKS